MGKDKLPEEVERTKKPKRGDGPQPLGGPDEPPAPPPPPPPPQNPGPL